MPASRSTIRVLCALAAAAFVARACGHDAADQAYLAALEAADHGAPIEEQLAHVERAIALRSDRASYYQLRAGYRAHLGDPAGAEADYDRAIALQDRPYLRFSRGNLIASTGEPARSLADFDAAIAGQPENTQFYRSRALARAAIGRGQAALADAEHVVAKLPQQAESWYARGVALLALDRPQDALADLDRALGQREDLVYLWRARADAYERLGDRDRADADRARAAKMREAQAGCGVCLHPYH